MKRKEFITKLVLGSIALFTTKKGIASDINIASEKEKSIKKRLFEIFIELEIAKKGEYQNFNWQSSFTKDMGMDSLDTVELIMKVEEKFEIRILDEVAENIQTPQKLLDDIKKSNPSYPTAGIVFYKEVDLKGDFREARTSKLKRTRYILGYRINYKSFKVLKGTKIFFFKGDLLIAEINASRREKSINNLQEFSYDQSDKKKGNVFNHADEMMIVNCK